MAESGQFDIYQTTGGVTAVTNPVQRRILAALAEEDRQLPELVELTGKAKSTLSSVHMRELLNRDLVEEKPHPTDSRRKIYALRGRPLGSSEVPVDQLREAVKKYARNTAPTGLALGDVLQILAVGHDPSQDAVRRQVHALGQRMAGRLDAHDPRTFGAQWARFTEEEQIADHLQLDFENMVLRSRPGPALGRMEPAVAATLLAGLATGMAGALDLDGLSFDAEVDGEAFRLLANRS